MAERKLRTKPSRTSVVAVCAPTPRSPASRWIIASAGSAPFGSLRHGVALRLHGLDLREHELEPVEHPQDPGLGVRRQRLAERRPELAEARAAVAPERVVALDAERGQDAADPVGEGDPLGDELLALAPGVPRVLFGLLGHGHHGADPGLAAQEGQAGPQQQVDVDRVGLGPAGPPVDRHAHRLDDVHLDPGAPEDPRQPEPGVAGLVGGDGPLDGRPLVGRAPLQPRDRADQRVRPRLEALLDLGPLQARDMGGDDPSGLRDLHRDRERGPQVRKQSRRGGHGTASRAKNTGPGMLAGMPAPLIGSVRGSGKPQDLGAVATAW